MRAGGRGVRAADVGQMGRGVDRDSANSRSGEWGERGRRVSRPHFAVTARATLLARFEFSARESVPAASPVRLARPGNRMREWMHERERPLLRPRILPQSRCPSPPRARRARGFPRRPLRVRPDGRISQPRLRERLRLPARELGLSRGAAHYRKVAARLVARFPEVVEPLRDGRLCLSSILALAKVITEANRHEVLPRFFHQSREEAKQVAVEIAPVAVVPRRTVVTVEQLRIPLPVNSRYFLGSSG